MNVGLRPKADIRSSYLEAHLLSSKGDFKLFGLNMEAVRPALIEFKAAEV